MIYENENILKYITLLTLFYSFIRVRHAENCPSTDLVFRAIFLPPISRSEISDQGIRDPVIRDGVRPVPRLASRTITLRELESAQDWIRSREREREEEIKSKLPFSLISLHLSSSFFPIPSLCASYFVNRMITRLRSRALPALPAPAPLESKVNIYYREKFLRRHFT